MEYDPVPQGQTNGDKRKRDAVFACLMDDRVDLGLELAEATKNVQKTPCSMRRPWLWPKQGHWRDSGGLSRT